MFQLLVLRGAAFLGKTHDSMLKTGRLVCGFFDRERAEVYRTELEQSVRQQDDVCPFDFSIELHQCTSFSGPILCDWLLDAGLTPPPSDLSEWISTWRDWWEVSHEQFTEFQRERVWQGLDKVACFDLLAVDWHDKATSTISKAYVLLRCLPRPGGLHRPNEYEVIMAYATRAATEHHRRRGSGGTHGDYAESRLPHTFPIVELDVHS